MSALPGNPFAEYHQHRPGVTEDNEQWAIAQATLALAFEQRTANLIAFYGDGGPGEAYDALHDLIVSRLGLGES